MGLLRGNLKILSRIYNIHYVKLLDVPILRLSLPYPNLGTGHIKG